MVRNKKVKNLLDEALDTIIEAIREEVGGNTEKMTDEEIDTVRKNVRDLTVMTIKIDSLLGRR